MAARNTKKSLASKKTRSSITNDSEKHSYAPSFQKVIALFKQEYWVREFFAGYFTAWAIYTLTLTGEPTRIAWVMAEKVAALGFRAEVIDNRTLRVYKERINNNEEEKEKHNG